MNQVAQIAEEQKHHPKWTNEWNKVEIWLSTHDKGNEITEKDKRLSKSIDDVYVVYTSKTASVSRLKIYTDGGSRGNPGPAASGYVLFDENDGIVAKEGIYLGITTNNQAEYQALKLALEAAKKFNAVSLDIYMDSLLIVNQIKGIYRVKKPELIPVYDSIKKLIDDFELVKFTHIPRSLNTIADAAVNEALDNALSSS